jgi:hypothetical protein
MNSKNFIIDKEYVLQKFSGKGGWTYIALPEIPPNKRMPFGWVIVSGYVDSYALVKYKLLPMGNEQLFLPIKAEIRKKIKKQVNDIVHLKLFIDTSPLKIPKEIILCFENEPKKAYTHFINLSEGQQKAFLDWVYSAKTEATKAARIIQMMDRVIKNEPFYKKNTNNK